MQKLTRLLVAVTILGSTNAQNSPETLRVTEATASTRQDDAESLRAEYAHIAKNLAGKLTRSDAGEAREWEPAVQSADERWRVITLEAREYQDRRVAAVAREGARAHDQLIKSLEGPGVGAILFDCFRLANGDATALLSIVDRHNTAVAEVVSAVQRRRAATMLLPRLAETVCGPVSDERAIDVDFDESWFGSEPDRIVLTNVSGQDLSRCTVAIDLRGSSGPWVRNIHFVDRWSAGEQLSANYASLDPDAATAIGGVTTILVQEVVTSLWCDQLRSSEELQYAGTPRDNDLRRKLQDIDVKVTFHEPSFFESWPNFLIEVEGVENLPECTVRIDWDAGSLRPAVAEKKFTSRSVAGQVDARTGRMLPHQLRVSTSRKCKRPDTVKVTLRIDGTSTTWVRELQVGR